MHICVPYVSPMLMENIGSSGANVELHMTVNHHVGAWNLTRVLWKSNACS